VHKSHRKTESPSKEAKVSVQNQISELIWDCYIDEYRAPDSSPEDEENYEDPEEVSHLQPDHRHSVVKCRNSSYSFSALKVVQSRPGQVLQLRPTSNWTPPSFTRTSVVHTHTRGPTEKDSETSHKNDGSSSLCIFLLYLSEIIMLLVMENNRYYHDHTDRFDRGPSLVPDVTEAANICDSDDDDDTNCTVYSIN
jgi:hypothetical protein